MLTIGLLILIFGVLAYVRRLHQQLAEVKFRHGIVILKDNLRRQAILGKVDATSFAFRYIDKSLEKAYTEAYYLTLFHIITLGIYHKDDTALEKSYNNLISEVKKNPVLESTLSKYWELIKTYLISQHHISSKYIFKPIIVSILGASWVVKKINAEIKKIIIFPELSDSGENLPPDIETHQYAMMVSED